MKNQIYKKEFSIGDMLLLAQETFQKNFKLILSITLIVYIPINIILFLLRNGPDYAEGFENIAFQMRINRILELLIGIISTMAIAYVVKNKIDGKAVNLEKALRKALSRWGSALGTNILMGIFLFGLTLLLIIPGVMYYIYWIFVPLVVILKNKGGQDALDYSKKIVEGRRRKVLGYSLVFGILASILVFVWILVVGELPINFVTDLITNLGIDIIISFFIVVTTVFFINFDATKKKEEKEEAKNIA